MFNRFFKRKINFLFQGTFRKFGYRKPESEKINDAKKTKKQDVNVWVMNLGVLFTIFGLVYMSVPVYRKFCNHMGLIGDIKQKDYSIVNQTQGKKNKSRKFKIIFESDADPEMNWQFEPEQRELHVHSGETALMFYKAFNNQTKPIIGVATYSVYPEYASQYFSKIQCFCFNQQMINAKEELLLPLYFYFEPEIEDDHNLMTTSVIRIHYRFFFNKSQELAEMVQNQKVIDINNKIKVLEIRKKKIELNSPEIDKIEKEISKSKVELANLYGE